MNTDNMTVVVLLSFLLAVAHCTDLQSTANSDEETLVEPIAQPTNIIDDHANIHESSTTLATLSERSGRQYYQPQAMFAYQQYPHRRAYKKPQLKKRPMRIKSGRRPGRPASRPRKQSPMPMQISRYRRLPSPVRTQQVNYMDYGEGLESNANAPSFDYDDPATANMAYMYGHAGHMAQAQATPSVTIMASSGNRKRPVAAATMSGYADESRETVVHLPVRVTKPTIPTVAVTMADPMNQLKQMVHEAMDEHFANRHQELYADGFDKQQVYSAKYKRQRTTSATATADKEEQQQQQQQQRTPDAVKSTSQLSEIKTSDADSDGSDDRLTLAQISAYMGAKPAETVLSAGGHRYVLSDALQQSYRQQQYQQPHHRQQLQQQQVQQHYGGEDRHNNQQSYLRYVSPFEAIYDLPVARWTYK